MGSSCSRALCAGEPGRPVARYADFKAALYGLIDPKFRGYFSADRRSRIRLDEVRWGASPRTAFRRSGARR